MSERKPRSVVTAAGVIALLLAGSAAPARATPPAAKTAAAKKVAKKPAKKAVKKMTTKKAVATPLPPPVVLPPPPPQPEAYLGSDAAPAPIDAYNDAMRYRYTDDSRYRYIDDADSLLDTVGTSPPDYTFRFKGVDCWAWELDSGDMVLAEPADDGYTFYTFGPGDAYPFFISDPLFDFSYGFDGRELAAIYGHDGQLIPWSSTDQSRGLLASDVGQMLSEHGRAMKESITARAPVIASDWASGITFFSGIELRFGDWRSQPGWSRYRIGTGSRHRRDWRARLGKDEGKIRRDRADRFDQWRRGGFRGAPPANKGGWNTAPGATRPGRPRSGPRPDGWNRPRPPVPAPGTPPRGDRPGDGQPGAGGRPERFPQPDATPPSSGQPNATLPTPPAGRDGPPRGGGTWRRNRGNNGTPGTPQNGGAPLPPQVDWPGKGQPGSGGRPGRFPRPDATPPPSGQPNATPPTPPAGRDGRPRGGTWRGNRGNDGAPSAPPASGSPLPPPIVVAPPSSPQPENKLPGRRGGRGGDRPIGGVAPPSRSPAIPPSTPPQRLDRPALGERPARGDRIDRPVMAPPPPPPVRVAPPPPPPPARVAPPPPPSSARPPVIRRGKYVPTPDA